MSYTSLNPDFASVTIGIGNINLPATTSSGGQVTIDANVVLHSYGDPTGSIFVGPNAGNFSNTTGPNAANSSLGSNTLVALTTGINNTALGAGSLFELTSGAQNCALSTSALGRLTTGDNNVGIGLTSTGRGGGYNYTTDESFNICISNTGVTGEDGQIRIGNATDQVACFIAGIAGVTVASSAAVLINTSTGQLGTVASSIRFKENINYKFDSSPVLKLKPATFTFKSDATKETHFGLIAEEVHEVMPELVLYDKENQPATVQYHELPVILLNELKKVVKRLDVLEKGK